MKGGINNGFMNLENLVSRFSISTHGLGTDKYLKLEMSLTVHV